MPTARVRAAADRSAIVSGTASAASSWLRLRHPSPPGCGPRRRAPSARAARAARPPRRRRSRSPARSLPTSSARRARRSASSSANTSSRISTGSPSRESARSSSADASRSASATDHDSPCEAYPFTGRPRTRRTRSSRCGPTSVSPRSSSAERRAASACAEQVRDRGSVSRPRPALPRPLQDRRRAPTAPTRSRGRWSAPAIAAYAAVSGARELGREREARLDQLRAERDELVVPHVEGRELIAADAADLRRLQQGGALLEHAVVVRDHAGEARRALHEQLIDEAPTRRGVAADDLQVFRSEQDDLRIAAAARRA